MIFFIALDGAGTVDLFGQQQAHKLMGEGKLGQGPMMVGPFEYRLVQPVSPADEKDEVLNAVIGARLDELGQGLRSEGSALSVQGHEIVVFLQAFEQGFGLFSFQVRLGQQSGIPGRGDDLPFYGIIPGDPFGEVFHARLHVGFMIFSYGPQLYLHNNVNGFFFRPIILLPAM